MTGAELKSDLKLTTDTHYLALMGELWGVYCKDFGENWPCYNGTALYYVLILLARFWNFVGEVPKLLSPSYIIHKK